MNTEVSSESLPSTIISSIAVGVVWEHFTTQSDWIAKAKPRARHGFYRGTIVLFMDAFMPAVDRGPEARISRTLAPTGSEHMKMDCICLERGLDFKSRRNSRKWFNLSMYRGPRCFYAIEKNIYV